MISPKKYPKGEKMKLTVSDFDADNDDSGPNKNDFFCFDLNVIVLHLGWNTIHGNRAT